MIRYLLNRPESWLTNPPGHLWRDKWIALSGPLPHSATVFQEEVDWWLEDLGGAGVGARGGEDHAALGVVDVRSLP